MRLKKIGTLVSSTFSEEPAIIIHVRWPSHRKQTNGKETGNPQKEEQPGTDKGPKEGQDPAVRSR